VRTVNGMQQLVYILAADAESKKIDKRFRLTDEIERRFKMVCLVPQEGSYALPVSLPALNPQLNVFGANNDQVFGKLAQILKSVADNNSQALAGIFKNDAYYRRTLAELRSFLPKADEPWKVGFRDLHNGNQSEVLLSTSAVKNVEAWLEPSSAAESSMTVTGELVAIDFDQRKISLRHPVTKKLIECFYDEELEVAMFDSRRDWVQVTGKFTLNEDGSPKTLINVSRIVPLDLTPLSLSAVTYNEQTFIFRDLLELTVELDEESSQFLCINHERLDLDVFARTREDLFDEVAIHIAFQWKTYAQCPDDRLTPEALHLKKNLLGMIEASNAA
jgi:hypothetical protein